MIPGKYNMTCPQGSTFVQELTYSIDSATVNLTGFSARMQVREKHTSKSTIISLNIGSGITVDGENGKIVISIDPSATSDIIAKDYVYDLELVSPSNQVTRIIEGKFIVTPEVTR